MTRTVKVLCIQTVTVCNSNIIQVTPTTHDVCMYVYILSYFVNKLEIWWLYLSPIEKNPYDSRVTEGKPDVTC